ncbi:hypothetical protein A0H81_02958 [Grifola frondosa]|uniref:Uncharacterized protein n=1 Tax=Grifola frondosa TaxID=5627 RepID=A0A1C7MH53_GRIFR|nr:hypothetical protein A0H81_02958 [Grifola frondosa]
MVNWQDPSVIAQDAVVRQDHYCGFQHLPVEWVTTLGFEWRLVTRQLRWKWPMLICILCRFFMLIYVILMLVGLNTTTELNCQVALRIILFLNYLCLALSSLLIVLRVIAIWNRNKYVIAFVTLVYCTDIAGLIYGNVQARSLSVSFLQLRGRLRTVNSRVSGPDGILQPVRVNNRTTQMTSLAAARVRGPVEIHLSPRSHMDNNCDDLLYSEPCVDMFRPERVTESAILTARLTICATRMQMSLYEHSNTDHVHAPEISTVKGSMMFAQNPAVRTGVHSETTVIPMNDLMILHDAENKNEWTCECKNRMENCQLKPKAGAFCGRGGSSLIHGSAVSS